MLQRKDREYKTPLPLYLHVEPQNGNAADN